MLRLAGFAALCVACLLFVAAPAAADRCECGYPKQTWFFADTVKASPLHAAAARGDVAGVKKAVEQGANVNRNVAGYTPLHVALLTTMDPYWHPYGEGVYSIVTFLLSKGANPNIPFPVKKDIAGAMSGSMASASVTTAGLTPLHWVAQVSSATACSVCFVTQTR
jgi:hypothetical protein